MAGSKPDFDNVTIFGDDEDPGNEPDDNQTVCDDNQTVCHDNQTVWDDNDDNETVLEGVGARPELRHLQALKKRRDAEVLLFERFKLLFKKGRPSLEKENPQLAAEHARSNSAAASSQQPYGPSLEKENPQPAAEHASSSSAAASSRQPHEPSLEKENPRPAAEHASSSSAAASSHQPHDLHQPCAKRKERKRNRQEMDQDGGAWTQYFTSHRHYEREVRPWWEEEQGQAAPCLVLPAVSVFLLSTCHPIIK